MYTYDKKTSFFLINMQISWVLLKARRMSTTKFDAKHFKNKEKSGNKFAISYMARVQRYLFGPQKSSMT